MNLPQLEVLVERVESLEEDPRPDPVPGMGHLDQARYRWLLYRVAKEFKPKVYVELGVHTGATLVSVAAASPDIRAVGIDISHNMLSPVVKEFANVELERANSVKYEWDGSPIDMILFDSKHTYEHLMAEIEIWGPYCRKGAILFFDDIETGVLKQAWEEIPEPKLLLPTMHEGWGFGVHIKE